LCDSDGPPLCVRLLVRLLLADWAPLEFDPVSGAILKMTFVDEYTLVL
jgi:hypothetical protein